jgi:toxin secretion/phage lysis holin
MNKIIAKIFTFFSSLLLFLFGNFDFLMKSMLILMILDYITGVLKAFVNKKVNSTIGGKGIIKKTIYLIIIAVSVILDQILNLGGSLRTIIITSFIFNEMLSILENSAEMGIKIPNILIKSLDKINVNDNEEK